MLGRKNKCDLFLKVYILHGGEYQVSHMTPVALPQDRAGAGLNKSTSSQFLELG